MFKYYIVNRGDCMINTLNEGKINVTELDPSVEEYYVKVLPV